METAWIQVFVLTLSQCIAPAGKMVCQEETVQYHFTNEEDCARALVLMVDLAARAENILVDRQRSNCSPGAKESVVYADADGAKESLANTENFVLIDGKAPPPDFMQVAHTGAPGKPAVLRGDTRSGALQDRRDHPGVTG